MLAQLEVDLVEAARSQPVVEPARTRPTEPWNAPEHLGPLPAELAERARRLLVVQRALVRELEEAKRTTGRHLAALRSVPGTTRTGASVYLDVTG